MNVRKMGETRRGAGRGGAREPFGRWPRRAGSGCLMVASPFAFLWKSPAPGTHTSNRKLRSLFFVNYYIPAIYSSVLTILYFEDYTLGYSTVYLRSGKTSSPHLPKVVDSYFQSTAVSQAGTVEQHSWQLVNRLAWGGKMSAWSPRLPETESQPCRGTTLQSQEVKAGSKGKKQLVRKPHWPNCTVGDKSKAAT